MLFRRENNHFNGFSSIFKIDFGFGRRGPDTIHGSSALDLIFGGRGDDLLVFDATLDTQPQCLPDLYFGGRGYDTLALKLSGDQWADPEIRSEVIAFLDWLDGGSHGFYKFRSLGLNVHSVEALELSVDGVVIEDPRTSVAPVIIDLSASLENEFVSPAGDFNFVITTGVGNDTVVTGGGDDEISTGEGDDSVVSGAGNDIITIGNGNDFVDAGAGDDTIIAGMGGGLDLNNGNIGNDLVAFPSSTQSLFVDLRAQDRQMTDMGGGETVGSILSSHGYSPTTLVGLATGGDIQTDILLSIENADGGSGADTIIGDDGKNRLRGVSLLSDNVLTDMGDSILGNGGDDTLDGGAGNDQLDGGSGNDRLIGGTGDDQIDGGTGTDTLVLQGDLADYTFTANADGSFLVEDILPDRDGSDIFSQIENVSFANTTVGLFALVGTINRFGTSGDDVLIGTAARERFYGYAGNDSLNGLEAEDQFIGGSGDDTLDGGAGTADDLNFVWDIADYWLEYEEGGTQGVTVDLTLGVATDTYGDTDTLIDIERIFGTAVDDVLIGDDDAVTGNAFDPHTGTDIIEGRGGYDNLRYNLSANFGSPGGITAMYSASVAGAGTVIDTGGFTDTFSGIEQLTATHYADIIVGGIGNDLFVALDGADFVDGGAGFDRMAYNSDASYGGLNGIIMLADTDGGERSITDGFGNVDTIVNIEWIRGTGARDELAGNDLDELFEGLDGNDFLSGEAGNDELIGATGNDELLGGTGADTLVGGEGEDTLNGGEGNDELSGGLDADTFEFGANTANDLVMDFSASQDAVQLNGVSAVSSVATDFNSNGFEDALVTLSDGGTIIFLEVEASTMQSVFGII